MLRQTITMNLDKAEVTSVGLPSCHISKSIWAYVDSHIDEIVICLVTSLEISRVCTYIMTSMLCWSSL